MCFAVFEYVPNDLAQHPTVKHVRAEFAKKGVLSDELQVLLQGTFLTIWRLQQAKAYPMDIAPENLGLTDDGHVVVLDAGNGFVLPTEGRRDFVAGPMVRQSTAPAKKTAKKTAKAGKKTSMPWKQSVSYYSKFKVLDLSEKMKNQDSGLGMRGRGRHILRDEAMVPELDAASSSARLESATAERWDNHAATVTGITFVRPIPKGDAAAAEWAAELEQGKRSPENMFQFLEKGLSKGASLQQPDVLRQYANLFYNLLRLDAEHRFGMMDALVSEVVSLRTWTPAERTQLAAAGIMFGTAPPRGSPWEGIRLPRLRMVLNDGDAGAGVVADEEISDGDLACLYVGTLVNTNNGDSLDAFAPNRYVVRFGPGLYIITLQSFTWCQEHNAAGPFLNAAASGANVEMRRGIPQSLWIEGNIAYIAMFGSGNIRKGQSMRWKYDETAGGGYDMSFP
jgi:hypothetical protein